MHITKDTAVTLTYKVTSPEGKPLDAGSLAYLHGGYDNIFPKVEAALEGQEAGFATTLELAAGRDLPLANTGSTPVECLLLQGRPLNEPVAQYGPFVMNTEQEIAQALQDYRRTEFGGWPWAEADPVHGNQPRRFARHPGQQGEEMPGLAPEADGKGPKAPAS